MWASGSPSSSLAAGLVWAAACAGLGTAWTLAAAWRAESGMASTFARGVLGGLAAAGAATGLYGLLEIAGVAVSWEAVAAPGCRGAGHAFLIGAVEESAKLAGIALAIRSRDPRELFRTTAAVAAVFAVLEAAVVLEGWSWPLAIGRAALAPVAHAALTIPAAFALAAAGRDAPARATWWYVPVGILVAALLHGGGDWSLSSGGWGRVGFALAMVVPVLWLYRQAHRFAPASQDRSVATSVRSSSATPQACATQPRGV